MIQLTDQLIKDSFIKTGVDSKYYPQYETEAKRRYESLQKDEPDYEDERLVLVPSNTMSEMLDDMCDLGMAVDDLLDIFYTLMDGGDISSDDLMERLIYAEDASEEAYARWGDSVRCMSE